MTELTVDDALVALDPFSEEVSFRAGDRIFDEGAPSEDFFAIDEGEVRLEVHARDVDSDNVLAYSGAGSLLGEVGLLAGTPRSATAVAHTAVRLRRFSKASLDQLTRDDPQAGVSVAWALGRDAASKLLASSQRVAEHLEVEATDPSIEPMVAAAVDAQRQFEPWPEEAVDALLSDVARAVGDRAEHLAAATFAETGVGNVPDKALKIRFGSMGVQAAIAGKTGRGQIDRRRDPLRDQRLKVGTAVGALYRLLRERPETWRVLPKLIGRPGNRVIELASPVGVVFALIPLTEPVGTLVDNVLIALKGRNAIILSSHRMAQGVTEETGGIIQAVLASHGAPVELVQWVRGRTSRQTTSRFMRHPDVSLILATGGAAMVKAAYSSGKPAIGVGPGNAPAWIAPDADLAAAARFVVDSKSFDHGLICGSEQHLIVDRAVVGPFEAVLERHGAVIFDEAETDRFCAGAFDPVTSDLRIDLVGKPAADIAASVGLAVPSTTRLLVFRAGGARHHAAVARERLAPVVSLFVVEGEASAIELCRTILDHEGAGHTAVVHTASDQRARRFAEQVAASRILVNVPASQGCGGVVTGLFPSFTLGCGTHGGNSTTENVGFSSLVNVKRMAGIKFANPASLATFSPAEIAHNLIDEA